MRHQQPVARAVLCASQEQIILRDHTLKRLHQDFFGASTHCPHHATQC